LWSLLYCLQWATYLLILVLKSCLLCLDQNYWYWGKSSCSTFALYSNAACWFEFLGFLWSSLFILLLMFVILLFCIFCVLVFRVIIVIHTQFCFTAHLMVSLFPFDYCRTLYSGYIIQDKFQAVL
jgi:hypothetical protein